MIENTFRNFGKL